MNTEMNFDNLTLVEKVSQGYLIGSPCVLSSLRVRSDSGSISKEPRRDRQDEYT